MAATTFVTAFLDLQQEHNIKRPPAARFEYFKTHIDAGLDLVIFMSRRFADDFEPYRRDNMRVIYMELEETDAYKVLTSAPKLPESRTETHDTLSFMTLINAKTEFMARAIALDPFSSTHFAWIDFSLSHVFRDREASVQYLRLLQQTCLKPKCLAIPGCWDKGVGMSYVNNAVNWRFCGGFFIGDKASILEFHAAAFQAYKDLFEKQGRVVWEVNTWAIAERHYGISPTWYKADHNDSIIHIPQTLFQVVASLTTIPSRIPSLSKTLDSLLSQVDHVYVSIADSYLRFGGASITIPPELQTEKYSEKVTFVKGPDYGPASKYLGTLSALPSQTWVFVCDDDQVYHPQLITNMLRKITRLGVYQNRYEKIKETSSGGLIHGYTGLMIHGSHLTDLPTFPLPDCARYVDDQWMSAYLFLKNTPIFKTGIEEYKDIYAELCGWHELIGSDALGSLGNRDTKVAELAAYFNIVFETQGRITGKAPAP